MSLILLVACLSPGDCSLFTPGYYKFCLSIQKFVKYQIQDTTGQQRSVSPTYELLCSRNFIWDRAFYDWYFLLQRPVIEAEKMVWKVRPFSTPIGVVE